MRKSSAISSLPALQLPFDPIERSKAVEQIVMRGNSRMYYRFRHANFYGPSGIVTGDMVGCNFLCVYCWNYGRNEKPNTGDAFYSPSQVATKLQAIATKKGCNQYRLSGAEPFLGMQSAKHIAEVIRATDGYFVIESNGFMIGYQPEILELFANSDVFWRITIKGHDSSTFQKVTGALGEFHNYPFDAIREIRDRGLKLQVAFNPEIVAFNSNDYNIEHEKMRSYAGVAKRMGERGITTRAPMQLGIRSKPTTRRISFSTKKYKPKSKEGDHWKNA